MKRKFWNWIRNETDGERTLVLNVEISDETWYGDEVTPALFRKELDAGTGNITVWINSPGGDCIAASQIYCMLMDYREILEDVQYHLRRLEYDLSNQEQKKEETKKTSD